MSRAKIAEFATALGDQNPAYFDEDSPIAPPTFAAVIAAQAWGSMFDDPDLGLAAVVLREGDDVVAPLTIERVRSRGGTDMVTIGVGLATVEGEPLGTATSQLIHTREEATA